MNTAITSLRVYDSSGVGCHSSSSITKHKHQLPKRMRQLRSGALQLLLITKRTHSSRERMQHLWCGVPQLLRHHQARTQLPECIPQLRCGAPQLLLITKARTQLRPNIWGSENIPAIGYKL